MQPVQDPIVPAFATSLQSIDSYDEIAEVLKSADFAVAGADERTIFLEDTLLMADGPRHAELNRMFSPLLSRQSLAYYELRLVEPVIQQTLQELIADRGADGTVRGDLVPMVHAALTRISATVTGVDDVVSPERTEAFRKLVLRISAATTASFSSASDPGRVISDGRAATETLIDDFLQPSLDRRLALVREHRQGRVEADDLPRDVLMSMCLADDLSHPDDAEKIPYIWRQCLLFLTASIKTTSHALPHVFVHIDEWVREHRDDCNKRTDPEWLHRAVAESLRLHHSAPARFRRALCDVVLSTGRKVAAGEMVVLHPPVANVAPEIAGLDGRYFNPNRQMPDGMKPWGLTFGLGVHVCLGQNLVTGIQNKGDEKHGTHGTAVRLLKALYDLGAELDPNRPPRRPADSLHDAWESVPVVLKDI